MPSSSPSPSLSIASSTASAAAAGSALPPKVEAWSPGSNALAAGYARWLEGRYVSQVDLDGLLRELRSTYRRGAGEKLGHLGARTRR